MPPRAARALGTGYRGRGSRSPPAEPPHPSPRTPGLPHWNGMGLPRPRAPSRLLWWPALTQRGPEPRPSAPTAAHGFAGLAPPGRPSEPRCPITAVCPAPGTWVLGVSGGQVRVRAAPLATSVHVAGESPCGGGGAPAQGAKHPSRCGRFLGEPKCYGSKSILRSNLSSLSSRPQEARLNHAGTMCGGGGCRFLPRRGHGDCRGARPAQWPPAGRAFSLPPPLLPPNQNQGSCTAPPPSLERGAKLPPPPAVPRRTKPHSGRGWGGVCGLQ